MYVFSNDKYTHFIYMVDSEARGTIRNLPETSSSSLLLSSLEWSDTKVYEPQIRAFQRLEQLALHDGETNSPISQCRDECDVGGRTS